MVSPFGIGSQVVYKIKYKSRLGSISWGLGTEGKNFCIGFL